MFPKVEILAAAACALHCAAPHLRAADINWNSSVGAESYTSAGAPAALPEGFMFELGSFLPGFEPTRENIAGWAAHWVAIDRAAYNATSRFFTSKASLTSNAQPFHPAWRPYIWGFDQGSPGEWILLSNPSWFWPIAGGGPQPPLTWSVAASGTVALAGRVNGSGFQMMTESVDQSPPDVSPAAWRQQHFNAAQRANPSVSSWDADPDSDGASNLYELAAGSDPHDPRDLPQLKVEMVAASGGGSASLHIRLPRRHRAAINYHAETSIGLAAWSASGMTLISNTATELVFCCPLGSTDQLFVRLSFSL